MCNLQSTASPVTIKTEVVEPWWKENLEVVPRFPPDVTVRGEEVRDFVVCGVCSGIIYNATTVTECMHTCKSQVTTHSCRSLKLYRLLSVTCLADIRHSHFSAID